MRLFLPITCLAATLFVGPTFAQQVPLNWRTDSWEPETPMFENPMAGATASASGHWDDRIPALAIDGNTDSANHWACEELPATLSVELAQPATLQAVRLWFYYAQPRSYQFFIEASLDGQQWTQVADQRDNQLLSTAEGVVVPFDHETEARFLRVTVTGSSVPEHGAHIVELLPIPVGSDPNTGLHGRVAETVRIDADNARGDEAHSTWQASAWRGERVNGQLVVWASTDQAQLRVECSELSKASGESLSGDILQARFVRYVLADGKLVGDVLDTAERVDLPANGYRPIWLSAAIPADASPGLYTGTVTVRAAAGVARNFDVKLEVLAATLPDPQDWTFYLDLWQHPWAVARYHDVEPFSQAHYDLLEPIYRELANAGQKVLTTTLVEQPWNHQNFDAYHPMIERTREADGSWSFDYTFFDQYVKFGRRCGIGPQIHCYSMLPWGNVVSWTDAETGDLMRESLAPGSPEFEAYWGPFLLDFSAHLEQKGWLEDTFMAMDERGPAELRAVAATIAANAPELKTAMAGNQAPSNFAGLSFDSYSQVIMDVDQPFLAEIRDRQDQGELTTFYVCTSPSRPNTFTFSPTAEQLWLGYYSAANGFDGLLRWSFCNWPRDPLFDTSFGNWPAGDTFLLYPGNRSSVRWEMLRDGIEEAEKIRLLRERGPLPAELAEALTGYDWSSANAADDATLEALVKRTQEALESASRELD